MDEINKILDSGISVKELERAKECFLTNMILSQRLAENKVGFYSPKFALFKDCSMSLSEFLKSIYNATVSDINREAEYIFNSSVKVNVLSNQEIDL